MIVMTENGYFNDFHAEEKIAETESEESLEGEDAPIEIKEKLNSKPDEDLVKWHGIDP